MGRSNPLNFDDLAVQPTKVPVIMWEKAFSNYLPYAHKFMPDMDAAQHTLEVLAKDVGLADEGRKVLEGLDVKLKPYRRWTVMQKAYETALAITLDLEAKPGKVVVFFVHRDASDQLREYLRPYRPSTIYAGTPPEKRKAIEKKFHEDKRMRVLCVHLESGYTMPDLILANRAYFIEASWRQELNVAAAMRVFNARQTMPVRFKFVGLQGSIDARIQQILKIRTRDLLEAENNI
jgi:SWI/SNF-related matrix-associated actin-dependent regulator 1 of chromatin subfamily A